MSRIRFARVGLGFGGSFYVWLGRVGADSFRRTKCCALRATTRGNLMERASEADIRLTEAAYDLEVDPQAWFPSVMDAVLPLIDHGLGVAGLVGTRPASPGPVHIEQVQVASGPPDFPIRMMRAMAELPPEKTYAQATSGVRVLSELAAEDPLLLEAWSRHIDYAKDGVGITALDPDGHGIHLVAAAPSILTLGDAARRRWRMLAAHLCAGLRLRTALSRADSVPSEEGLPLGAEAVLDPKTFTLTEAIRDARSPDSTRALREAAIRMDRARGRLRKSDPEEALEIWKALVRGRWSVVNWFDNDQRRYVLAVPNPPKVRDPRGLTKRESQVVAYACLGESHKTIAYRLGISRSRVSYALRCSMRKFGVSTQAQLVEKLRPFGAERSSAPVVARKKQA